MKSIFSFGVIVLACCFAQQVSVDAATQAPMAATNGRVSTKTGLADGAQSPALTGDRRPLYRLRKSDQIEIDFIFSPEFNQLANVQPDGFITLRGVPQIYAQGLTVPDLVDAVRVRYSSILNDPEVAVVLKDFDKPYFLVGGEVGHPGKYELRDDITLTEALMIAGGFTSQSKHSQVVLFRDVSDNTAQSRLVNVKSLSAKVNSFGTWLRGVVTLDQWLEQRFSQPKHIRTDFSKLTRNVLTAFWRPAISLKQSLLSMDGNLKR
jgi:protein involved in polysaccharide export with SLBB domain